MNRISPPSLPESHEQPRATLSAEDTREARTIPSAVHALAAACPLPIPLNLAGEEKAQSLPAFRKTGMAHELS